MPQDLKTKQEKQRQEAEGWRPYAGAGGAGSTPAAGGAGAGSGPGKGKGKGKAPGVLVVRPEDADILAVRELLPAGVGASVWYELQTDRVRMSYGLPGQKNSRSASVAGLGMGPALVWCLERVWQEHTASTGEKQPFTVAGE